MLTKTTPRPAGVIAGAVLLIVIAAQVALASLVGIALFIFEHAIPPCGCCFVWVVLLLLFLVAELMKLSLGILNGAVDDLFLIGCRVQAFGALAITFAIIVSALLYRWFDVELKFNSQLFHFLLWSFPICFDAVALFISGLLFRKYSKNYADWKYENHRESEDDGYETDSR